MCCYYFKTWFYYLGHAFWSTQHVCSPFQNNNKKKCVRCLRITIQISNKYRLKLFYFEMYQLYWSWCGYDGLVHSDSHWQWQQAATATGGRASSEQQILTSTMQLHPFFFLFFLVWTCIVTLMNIISSSRNRQKTWS